MLIIVVDNLIARENNLQHGDRFLLVSRQEFLDLLGQNAFALDALDFIAYHIGSSPHPTGVTMMFILLALDGTNFATYDVIEAVRAYSNFLNEEQGVFARAA